MGYYCTVPQCTSLAGKTKNVKFHRFPRDESLADKWNLILKRNKPYTKYSKVCSLHFTQGDYNLTTMGQWKTLAKDALPTQNLPKVNADGTVMVIRKSRSLKYKAEPTEVKREREDGIERQSGDWANTSASSTSTSSPGCSSANQSLDTSDSSFQYRLNSLNAIANNVSPAARPVAQLRTVLQQNKPPKQDAMMQTDPPADPLQLSEDEERMARMIKDKEMQRQRDLINQDLHSKMYAQKSYDDPKNYTKDQFKDNEDYNKEAESYALERTSKRGDNAEESQSYGNSPENYRQGEEYETSQDSYEDQQSSLQPETYQKQQESYPKQQETYTRSTECSSPSQPYGTGRDFPEYQKRLDPYATNYVTTSADILRNQQHNLQMLQQHSNRMAEQLSSRIAEDHGNRMAEQLTNRVAEDHSDRMTERLTDRMTEEHASRISGQLGNRMVEELSNRMAKEHGNSIADQVTNRMADEHSSRIAEEMSNRLVEQHSGRLVEQQGNAIAEAAGFYTNRIKEELDLSNEEETFLTYENVQKEDAYTQSAENALFTQQQRHHLLQQQQRLMEQLQHQHMERIKTEPDMGRGGGGGGGGGGAAMQQQPSPLPYYREALAAPDAAYYGQREEALAQQQAAAAQQQQQLFSQQPGAELLIAKQNALAAHTTLWQNSMKRPFFYSEAPQFNTQLHARYEDLTRLLNQ